MKLSDDPSIFKDWKPMDQERLMKPTSNRLYVEWLPVTKIGRFFTEARSCDYWNTNDIKTFKVIAAGPGRVTRKGVLIPNEIKPGDNVIVDGRQDRPEPLPDGRFMIKNPDKIVMAIIPPSNEPISS